MTKKELQDAIGAIELALTNSAMIDAILGHGPSQANRDIKLGLNTEQSKPVLEAILAVLQDLVATAK